ncbi:MAG: metallophosphoesterase [Pseudomonadota bacterium]
MTLWFIVMKTAHLSDLHFGRHICEVRLKSLGLDLTAQKPDLLIITGDVTDRGHRSQYRRAKHFLDSLSTEYISVPGNREVPASAFWEWMLPPLAMTRYSSFFGPADRVVYASPANRTVFFGLNSVHPFPAWPGRIRRDTRYWLKEQIAAYDGYFKGLFLHHPVLPVIRGSSFWAHSLSDAGEILNICSQLGVFIILQGHKHRSAIMSVSFPERGTGVVVSAVGAPLMPYGDPAYHIITIDPSVLTVEAREYQDGSFRERTSCRFPIDGPG